MLHSMLRDTTPRKLENRNPVISTKIPALANQRTRAFQVIRPSRSTTSTIENFRSIKRGEGRQLVNSDALIIVADTFQLD